jgi:hypothetical protein
VTSKKRKLILATNPFPNRKEGMPTDLARISSPAKVYLYPWFHEQASQSDYCPLQGPVGKMAGQINP